MAAIEVGDADLFQQQQKNGGLQSVLGTGALQLQANAVSVFCRMTPIVNQLVSH